MTETIHRLHGILLAREAVVANRLCRRRLAMGTTLTYKSGGRPWVLIAAITVERSLAA